MDMELALYWLRATRDYLEADYYRQMTVPFYVYDTGIRQMINAIDSAIDHFDREIQSCRNYDIFSKEGEFPW